MRRKTALRLAPTAVLAGLAATACGTGSTHDPANAVRYNLANLAVAKK
ncbi:hypothetical protein [Streptomyces sp. AS02]|nr:hypothetical protein [Streptomyces sp. AS02]MCL8011596.1 hypothetical protein [Streptomyces sp. AS02]